MSSEARVAANRRNAEKSTGPRTPHTSKADCAKQSQFPEVAGGSGTAVGATPCGCPGRAQGPAPTASGERPDHCQAAIDGASHHSCSETATDSVKQSQSATGAPCETKPIEAGGSVRSVPDPVGAGFKPALRASEETPCGVTTNGADCAKQSQPAKPVKGFVMVPRHARVAWQYHEPGR